MKLIVSRSRPRWLRVLAAGVICYLHVSSASWAADDANRCVECHEKEVLPISLGHSFAEWRASSHAKSGVACEKCHGGDPLAADAGAAHAGVLSAADPASLIHGGKVAAMCGSCHEKEWKAFKSTVHAKDVSEDEPRATCLTCHDSMATNLPTPAELRTRCAVCHEKSVEAQSSLAVLANAKIQLYRTRRILEDAKARDPQWYEDALKRFHELELSFRTIQLEWHTFEMKKVLHDGMNVLKLSKLLDEEARLRAHMPNATE
jgi:hypothetical protein